MPSQINDLALTAGRAAQSSQTKMIHLHYEDPFGSKHATIPLVENFLFALALLRTRLSDNVLEAKELLQRLLHFQVQGGNFPVYLHEFPKCREPFCCAKIFPVLFWIQKDFGYVLGQELQDKLATCADGILLHCAERETPPPPHIALLISPSHTCEHHHISPVVFATSLIAAQMQGDVQASLLWNEALSHWHVKGESYEGPNAYDPRYQGGPYRLLYDLYMHTRHETLPHISHPHPFYLYAALIQPHTPLSRTEEVDHILTQTDETFRLMWTDGTERHILSTEGNFYQENQSISISVAPHSEEFLFTFDLETMENTKIFINNKRATIFHLKDEVVIHTSSHCLTLSFTLEGEGHFMGHLSQAECTPFPYTLSKYRANRKWLIAIRAQPCLLKVHWNLT